MLKIENYKIYAMLPLIIILLGITTFVIADEKTSDKLLIEEVIFTSSIYQDIEVTDFVENFSGSLDIKIRNDEVNPSPIAVLSAQLHYNYPRTNPSGAVNPPSFLKDTLQLGRKELPSINPNKSIQFNLKTRSIDLKGPPVNNTVKLSIRIHELNAPSNILYSRIYKTYSLVTETEIKEKINKKEVDNTAGFVTSNNVFPFIISMFIVLLFILVGWLIQSQLMQRKESTKTYGPGSGGYIIVDLPNNQKALFHDLLKGFEDYAKVKGYSISFSVDNSLDNKIAFKFTVNKKSSSVSSAKVKRDLKEYIKKVQEDSPLDDLPVVIPDDEHQLLLTTMKNRINFLQHNYRLQKNITEFYESVFRKFSLSSTGVVPQQNFYLQGGGVMDRRKYSSINSQGVIQGENIKQIDLIVDQSIRIAKSFNERKAQVDLISKLIDSLNKTQDLTDADKNKAVKNLENINEELTEEESPDPTRIEKWLNKAKSIIKVIKKGSEVVGQAKDVFDSFQL